MMRRRDKQQQMFDLILLALAVAGLAINVLLLSRHWQGGGSIAGCGGGDCEEVLTSRWAYVFRLPVTVFGMLAYLVLIASFRRRLRRLQLPMLGWIAGGACWFLFVQAVLLDRYCPWCVAAHSLAISMSAICLFRMLRRREPGSSYRRLGTWALVGIFALGLAQLYGPAPVTHRVEDQTPAPSKRVLTNPSGNPAGQPDETAVRDLAELPLLGSLAARHVLVEYFDYRCGECRRMSEYLAILIARHPDQVAVRLAPVPMDRLCNSHVPAGAHKPGGCDISKMALVIWIHAPAQFPEFHRELFVNPTYESARRAAQSLMTAEELDERFSEPRVMDVIRANVAEWRRLSLHNEKLPKLLIREKRILHGLPPSQGDFLRVMQQELGL